MKTKKEWKDMSQKEKQEEILSRAFISKAHKEWQEEGRKRCADHKIKV